MLPEYYLTERELEIIERHRQGIAAYASEAPFNLVELGAGFSPKSILLLEYFAKTGLDFQYVHIDISESAMAELVNSLEKLIPRQVNGLVTDYQRAKVVESPLSAEEPGPVSGVFHRQFHLTGVHASCGICGTVSITMIR